jgi:predicted amidophosphoribosyltransferase
LISRGKCEGCRLDLGNRLDPYCWRCAEQLERAAKARMEELAREREEAAS